ncbi:YggS family pyridoxal phosphate-dependent enzyme [Flavicella sediminum]|uniref:YggS family pyridoxal phosphate-dependent enzyme n=1 Tax=Flavicella sediminum TaxID=2585141 RepID=UPI00111D8112|nr:YggS family pyridoxal phosphate-dependent enzyme [Flavicella sediminum]
MSIKENLKRISDTLPENVTLVAVSKTKPISAIEEAYAAGQRVFGENKVQEMVEKFEALPKDISWHLIGHLQKNKVKYIAPFVHLIHGIDSFSTLKEINKQAKKHDRIISCLLQVKIAEEETKFGFSIPEVRNILASKDLVELKNIAIKGFMGMASFTDNTKQIANEFQTLKSFFDEFQLQILSMGMSGDYKIAIKNGSTMVRVGSSIFGTRNL